MAVGAGRSGWKQIHVIRVSTATHIATEAGSKSGPPAWMTLCERQRQGNTTAGRTLGRKGHFGKLRKGSSGSLKALDRYSIMRPENLKKQLCNAFCGAIDVRPVPSGLAISSAFEDSSGDRLGFYLTGVADEGFQIEDDGSYLSHLIAKDIPIDQGTRGQLLDSILSQGHAYWDRETLEIKSDVFPEKDISRRVVDFLSALIRVRDLELLTRDIVRSTFREDATAAIRARFGNIANINENEAINRDFSDFPADLIIKPTATVLLSVPGAIYFVNTNDKLNEALLLQTDALRLNRSDFEVIALLEEPDLKTISHRRFQRAQNRSLAMPIFRGDEDAAMTMIGRKLKLITEQGVPVRN
jgi:hypothetical protein